MYARFSLTFADNIKSHDKYGNAIQQVVFGLTNLGGLSILVRSQV